MDDFTEWLDKRIEHEDKEFRDWHQLALRGDETAPQHLIIHGVRRDVYQTVKLRYLRLPRVLSVAKRWWRWLIRP